MSIAKVGEVIGAEVTAINSAKSVVILELDSAERAIMLPSGLAEGVKFDSIREGQQFKVLVVQKSEGWNFQTRFLVSQRLDAEVFDPEHLEETAERRQPQKPNPELVAKYPVGRKVSGTVVRSTGDGIVVMIDRTTRALLPFGELGATKQASLRDKCNVKAVVLRVEGNQLVLSKKAA
jgi:hypothetical protein